MKRDPHNFLSLKKKEKGNVTFGDDVSTKILGRTIFSLGHDKEKA